MVDFELPEVFEASIGIYSETDIKKSDDSEEELLFRETRNFNFCLGNLGSSNAEKLSKAKQILDELAEEICYLTSFGVQSSQITTYHQQKHVLIKNEYTQFHPAGEDVFRYALVLETDYSRGRAGKFILPYYDPYFGEYVNSFPKNRFGFRQWYCLCDESRVRMFQKRYPYTRAFQPKGQCYQYTDHQGQYQFENIEDDLFLRFLRKIEHPTEGVFYYYRDYDKTYQRYRKIQQLSIDMLSKTQQSILLQGKREVDRKVKNFRAKKAKEEQRLRKKQGKPPIPEKIYIIQMTDRIYKIGVSNRPKTRIRSLQTSSPHKLSLLHTFPTDHGRTAEEKLHKFFHTHRLEGEWFQLDASDIDLLQSIKEYRHGEFHAEKENTQLEALNRL